jgi:hypothetical protein
MKYEARTGAEYRRVFGLLVALNIEHEGCQATLTLDIAPVKVALHVAAPEMLEALKLCENIIGMAHLQGKLDDSAASPVNDALVAARTALDKVR